MTRRLRGWIDDANPDFVINLAKGQAAQDLFVIAMTQGRRQGTWLELGAWQPIAGSNTYLLETRYQWSGISIDIDDHSINVSSQWEQIWSETRQPSWPHKLLQLDELDPMQQNQFRDMRLDIWMQETLNHIDFIDPSQRSWANIRPKTSFYKCDAMTFEINSLPAHIDYLQVDIDPVLANLEILFKLVPQHEFSVITFEHDIYMSQPEYQRARTESRQWLWAHGYELIAGDVAIEPYLIEDKSLLPAMFEDWWVHPRYISRDTIELYRCPDQGPKYWEQILTKELS